MSSKGKGKEKEKPAVQPPPSPEEPTEREIVPGKLTETVWLQLLEREEGVCVARELLEEVVDVAFSVVHSHYLERQAFPHATQQAKTSLLKIIEWQFLSRDEGERDTTSDPSWTEDEEPLPVVVDSWARGLVPQSSLEYLESGMEAEPPVRLCTPPTSHHLTPSPPHTTQSRRVTTTSTLVSSVGGDHTIKSSNLPSSTRRKAAPHRPRPVARRLKARLQALSLPPPLSTGAQETADSESGESEPPPPPHSSTPSSSLLHHEPMRTFLPYGMRPAQLRWQKDISYDERGNIVDMVKLDTTKFPSHCVRPRVTIIQPPQDSPKHKRPLKTKPLARKSTLEKDHPVNTRGREVEGEVREGQRREQGRMTETRGRERFPDVPTLPPLVDTIDPSSGVTVREAGRTVQGPRTHRHTLPSSPRHHMHPLLPPPLGEGGPADHGYSYGPQLDHTGTEGKHTHLYCSEVAS